jgi:predicted amidophosphoribosyltransferase
LKNVEKNEPNEGIKLLYSTIDSMSLLKTALNTFTEALFPIPEAERAVLAMGAQRAFRTLPRAEHSPIPEACSIFSYKDERVWRLIWSIKYKKSSGGATIAGYALYKILRSYVTAMTDETVAQHIIVVPMPITQRRRRERGFNQCELMANEIERLTKFGASQSKEGLARYGATQDDSGRLAVARDLLVRRIHKSRQTLKDREERLESAQEIFAVNEEAAQRIMNSEHLKDSGQLKDGKQIEDGHSAGAPLIIVIDDVVTTGSTIKDAVMTLRRAGFEQTFGLSVAH